MFFIYHIHAQNGRDVGNNPKFVWSHLLCFIVNQTSISRLVMVKSSLFGMFHDYLIAFRTIFDGWIVPCMAYISCPSRPLFSRQLRALQMRLQLLGERRELLSEEGKGQAGADGGPKRQSFNWRGLHEVIPTTKNYMAVFRWYIKLVH